MVLLLAENGKNDIVLNSSNSIWKLLGLILLCAVIIIACYYTTKFVGKRSQGMQSPNGGRNIKSLETFRVAPNKFLQLIKCGDKYLLIGITKDRIKLLSEIDGDSLLLETKGTQHKKFKDIISSLSLKNGAVIEDDDGRSNGSASINDVIASVSVDENKTKIISNCKEEPNEGAFECKEEPIKVDCGGDGIASQPESCVDESAQKENSMN